MEWKRIENVIRRTKLPMIVTEGVEEPLIIMPLAAYENLILSESAKPVQGSVESEPVVVTESVVEMGETSSIKEEESVIMVEMAQPAMPFSGFLREDQSHNFAQVSDFSASERLMF
ncbi:MAG: hypothetical protein U0487_02445 [Patescibacteria group bacterium]